MKETKSTLGYLIGRNIMDYWSWWTEELWSFIPLPLRRLLFNTNKLILEVDRELIKINRVIGNRKSNIAQISINELSSSQVKKIIRESNATEKILVISHHQVLIKHVTFPMATEENIREVLSFEMDRLTPFSSGQVYYDYYLISRNKPKNTIDLKLIIAPKDKIDNLLSKLREIGFQPHIVTIKNDQSDKNLNINLLPADKRAKKINALKVVNYTLTGILCVLFIISLLLPIWHKTKYIETLKPEINSYTESAEKIIKLRKQVDKAEDEASFLSEKKRTTLLMLEVVDELTQIVPDDTWVNQLEVNNKEIHIHGESISSASLLTLIESTKIFSDAQFRSPVTQNKQNNTERYHLSAKITQDETL